MTDRITLHEIALEEIAKHPIDIPPVPCAHRWVATDIFQSKTVFGGTPESGLLVSVSGPEVESCAKCGLLRIPPVPEKAGEA